MAMITTFIASSLLSRGLGFWWAPFAALAHGFLLRVDRARPECRRLEANPLDPVIITIGLVIVIRGTTAPVRELEPRFPAAFSQSGLVVGHTEIAFSHFDLFIAAAVLLLMGAILVLFRATTLGLRMRASAFHTERCRGCLECGSGGFSPSGGHWPEWLGRWPVC